MYTQVLHVYLRIQVLRTSLNIAHVHTEVLLR